jgi:DNA-binding response OmpR family regulator
MVAPTLNLLLVKANLVSAFSMRQRLEAAGHHVVGVTSESAMALRLAEQQAVHLALVSLQLEPPGRGEEMARLLQQERGVPTLLITAARQEAPAPCLGAIGFVQRPFSGPQLVAAVRGAAQFLAGQQLSPEPECLTLF